MKKDNLIGFADLSVERRKIKSQFFNQINIIVNWRPISNLINKHYSRGVSAVGTPAYPGLLLFKMSLLQTWYGLSDYEVEDRLNDSISFSRFVGLSLDDKSPDHSVLSRFRSELTQKGIYEKLFRELNKQLEMHKVIIKTGALIDASVTDTLRKPKGKAKYEIAEDRAEEERPTEEIKKEEIKQELIKKTQPGVDTEARWLKKAGKLHYGYKKHCVTDNEGMVLGILTTEANINEIVNLEDVLNTCELPEGTPVYMDKGYSSAKNREILRKRKLKDRIMHKATKKNKLGYWENLFNKGISKTRYKVERTFGGMKRWFGAGIARYVGMAKTHTQHLMEAMAYNLYRSPGIIMSSREK